MDSMNAYYILKLFAIVTFLLALISLLLKFRLYNFNKIRSDTTDKNEIINQIFINILFLFAVYSIIIMTLLYPVPNTLPTITVNIKDNYIPLVVISELIKTTPFIQMAYNIIGNIVLFIPFGFLLPLRTEKMRKFMQCVMVGFSFSVGIELCQLLLPHRQTDIDDVLLNTVGVILG